MSVRKRVIKILKDICIAQPDFPKITEICVKMIRRINDADGIKVRYVVMVLKKDLDVSEYLADTFKIDVKSFMQYLVQLFEERSE